MELTVKMNFWFDGIEDCTEEEVKEYLIAMLESGAESTSSEVDQVIDVLFHK